MFQSIYLIRTISFFDVVWIYFVFCHSAHFAVLNLEIISNEHINTDLTYDRICYSAQLKLPVHRSGSLPFSWAWFFWCRSVKRTSIEIFFFNKNNFFFTLREIFLQLILNNNGILKIISFFATYWFNLFYHFVYKKTIMLENRENWSITNKSFLFDISVQTSFLRYRQWTLLI